MQNKIDHIIARVLSNEASLKELLLLDEWLNSSEENRDEFRQIERYWHSDLNSSESILLAMPTEKLAQRITESAVARKRRWLFVAAAIVIVMITSFSISFMIGGLKDNDAIEHYTYVADQQMTSFTLPDSTKITLNKNSRLSYSNTFGIKKRAVELQGEAYFDVTKDPASPFIVTMDEASVHVLGTTFNLNNRDSSMITVALVEGAISFNTPDHQTQLNPSQQLSFCRSTKRIEIKNVDPDLLIAWKDGLIKYKSISFQKLIDELGHHYGIPIIIENQELLAPHIVVTASFSQDNDINHVLSIISRSLPIRWTNSNGTYRIQ